jgi:hypothetical protein
MRSFFITWQLYNDMHSLFRELPPGQNEFPENMYLLKTDGSGNVNCRGFNRPLYDSTCISTGNPINQTITNPAPTLTSPVINVRHMVCSNYGDCTVRLTELSDNLPVKIYPNPNSGYLQFY